MPYVRRMASQRTPLYHYRVKDKIVGPICLTDLHALLVSKKILPDTMIREEHSQCWMPLATELRRQERLARLRASAFMLSCRPPKSCLLFYIIALLLLACGVAHSIMLHTIPLHGSAVRACHSVFHGKDADVHAPSYRRHEENARPGTGTLTRRKRLPPPRSLPCSL